MKRTMTWLMAALTLLVTTVLVTTGLAAPAATAAEPLPVSTTTTTVTASGRTFSALVVRPTAASPARYPVIAFGHGFVQSPSRYGSTLRALAARGYIVVAPTTQGGFFPDHSAFADDLAAAVVWGHSQPGADPRADAVVGHSMGGGAAVLAARRNPTIDAVATLAAAETSPSAVTAAAGISAPALFVVGSADKIVAPTTTRRMYAAKPSPATWDSITGGYHCGFLDSSSFFGLGCDSGSISRSAQLALSQRLLGSWLDTQLKGAAPVAAGEGVVSESR